MVSSGVTPSNNDYTHLSNNVTCIGKTHGHRKEMIPVEKKKIYSPHAVWAKTKGTSKKMNTLVSHKQDHQ